MTNMAMSTLTVSGRQFVVLKCVDLDWMRIFSRICLKIKDIAKRIQQQRLPTFRLPLAKCVITLVGSHPIALNFSSLN